MRSPQWRHKPARRMRPPSSGAAGIRLKAASRRLIFHNHDSTSTGSPWPPAAEITSWAAPNPTASTTLVPGPTAAMRKSAPAVWASPSSWATPPNIHRVIDRTPTPLCLATNAWDTS